jgi:hypothetical protein
MSNFEQKHEQYGTASETNPLLNNTVTIFKITAYDNPANDNELRRRFPQ